MLSISESPCIEEIIQREWPQSDCDAFQEDDSSWDILDEDSSHDAVNRHWFKQNYINQVPPHKTHITYH